MASPPDDPSGIMVYPKMPIPPNRPSDPAGAPKIRGFTSAGGGYSNKKIIIGMVLTFVVGLVIGFFVRPTHGDEVQKAKDDASAAQMVSAAEKKRADGLDTQLQQVKKDKDSEDKELDELKNKSADVDKKAAELAAEEKKIQGTIAGGEGSVSMEGNEIHLKLVDKLLFPTGEDQLTDKGKTVLDKFAAALKEMPDKQIWVQGHTDSQPIFVSPPKKAVKPPPKGKPAPKGKPEDEEPDWIRYKTNWELSAARALEVVHYLQDKGHVDPRRLAAVAFGQWRPISKSDLAANRRIEIVLYPKKQVLEKAPPAAPAPAPAPKK